MASHVLWSGEPGLLWAGQEDSRPALGETWKAQANMRLQLSCHGPTLRKARLAACSITPCGAMAWFDIVQEGLVPAKGHAHA
jgi:hypothetical protein